MKEGQYIYFKDRLGVVYGIINSIDSYDVTIIKIINTKPPSKTSDYDIIVNLKQVKEYKLYETMEDLLKEHFSSFL